MLCCASSPASSMLTLACMSPVRSSRRCSARGARRQSRRDLCPVSAASSTVDGGPGDGVRVVVLGGGFGGLYAALRLNALPWPQGKEPQVCVACVLLACLCLSSCVLAQVTLVDQSSRFAFKPLMYELLMGDLSTDEARAAPRTWGERALPQRPLAGEGRPWAHHLGVGVRLLVPCGLTHCPPGGAGVQHPAERDASEVRSVLPVRLSVRAKQVRRSKHSTPLFSLLLQVRAGHRHCGSS